MPLCSTTSCSLIWTFTLPRAATGRQGFPKEAMVCAFIVMKCERFSFVTDMADYLDNNRLIAHYCGFDIMKPLLLYWTYNRFLKKLDNGDLKEIMAEQVKKLYELGIVDASFIGLDSTPVAANTRQNNPKSFTKDKFKPEHHPKADPDCALGVHSASNQHDERHYEFYWGYKNHVLVDCISGLPLYELTTSANAADSSMVRDILRAVNEVLPVRECTFWGNKGYDVKEVYDGEAFIPLNKRNTKDSKKFPAGNPICDAGLAMYKDGKTSDGHGGLHQKFCCPFRQSKTGCCPCDHKNWNNGKRNVNATTHALRLPVRNAFGSVTETALPT